MIKSFDYIVLGAGSAGSVITKRIIESKKSLRVALIEAGRLDYGNFNSWQIQMPAALTYSVASDQYNWDFYSTKQKKLNNRRLHAPRGKVLGGSSSINAMVYARGHSKDFDRWEKEGAKGWSYDKVLPFFKKAQNHVLSNEKQSEFRGYEGPLQTRNYPFGHRHNELFDVFEEAGIEKGYPRSQDLNGEGQEGFGSFDMTVGLNGVRCSASKAYLHPLIKSKSPQLTLFTETMAMKINFKQSRDSNDKLVADSISCKSIKTGEEFVLKAEKEIIISLGAVGSPQLLMLSGIGDPDHLTEHKIPVKVENKQVGQNLQDHLEVYLQYLLHDKKTQLSLQSGSKRTISSVYPIATWDFSNPLHLLQRCFIGLKWFMFGTGICASNLFESGAFIKTWPDKEHPDVQYHFIPAIVQGQLDILKQHGFQIHSGTLRGKSRGELKLVSANIEDAPLIDPNYMAVEEDMADFRQAIRLAHDLTNTKAFKPFVKSRYGEFSDVDLEDDNSIDDFVRSSSQSAYHLSCTCSMGSVVSSEGVVKGTGNLRVVDASIMPSITSGNLNAPTIMMAEKISHDITRHK